MSINILKKFKKQGGFTLLELLIVIVIIGILALLIIPNITSAPKKARDTTRKADITAMRKSLEEYFVSNNSYPTVADYVTDLQGGATPLMKAVPIDPKANPNVAPYTYVYALTGSPVATSSYSLTACLENASDNSANVIGPVSPCTTKSFQVTSAN